MRKNEYKNTMTITNDLDYEFWIWFFRTDESIEEFEVINESDYSGFMVTFNWNYVI